MVIPPQYKDTLIHRIINLRIKAQRHKDRMIDVGFQPWQLKTTILTYPYTALAAALTEDKPI